MKDFKSTNIIEFGKQFKRPRIDLFDDLVNHDAGVVNLPGFEGLEGARDGICPGELTRQSRVEVYDLVLKMLKKLHRKDAHEAGQHDEVRLERGDQFGEGLVVGSPGSCQSLERGEGMVVCGD